MASLEQAASDEAVGSPPMRAAGYEVRSHEELRDVFVEAAATTTALTAKVGKVRGSKRMTKAGRSAKMDYKVNVTSGDTGWKVVPTQ